MIQTGAQESWDWPGMGEGGMYTSLQRQQGTQHGRDNSGHGGPNRMATLSEKVSGSQSRGLGHVGLMKFMSIRLLWGDRGMVSS